MKLAWWNAGFGAVLSGVVGGVTICLLGAVGVPHEIRLGLAIGLGFGSAKLIERKGEE